jgi:hypothetical protein
MKVDSQVQDSQRALRSVASIFIILLTSVTLISLISVSKIQPPSQPTEPTPLSGERTISTESKCKILGGVWLENWGECENITEDQCTELDGTYANCESACRHDPTAEVCIEICVAVCKL